MRPFAMLIDPLQPATSVGSACALGSKSALLVPRGDALHIYSPDPEAGLLEHRSSFSLHLRIEAVIGLGGKAAWDMQQQQQRQQQQQALVLLSDASLELYEVHASLRSVARLAGCVLHAPEDWSGAPVTLRPEGAAVSHALAVQHGRQHARVTLVAMHHGCLHVVKLQHADGGDGDAPGPSHAAGPVLTSHAVHLLRAGLMGTPPPPPPSAAGSSAAAPRPQQDIHVRALELMPVPGGGGGSGGTKCLAVLLHQTDGPHPGALNLDCLELDWAACRLAPGPWSCRNVHPTTSLLLPFDPSISATAASFSGPPSPHPAGMLVFSSRSLQLFTCAPPPSASSLAAAMAAARGDVAAAAAAVAGSQAAASPGRIRLLEWTLPGVPACAEWLSPTVLALGDSMAGLHLVSLGGSAPSVRRIQVAGPPAVPSVLCFLPRPAQQQCTQDGLLFLGSRVSNSQTLVVPAGTAVRASEPLPASAGLAAEPPAINWSMSDPALIKSLAPVQACVTIPDRQGAQDASVLVCCGIAPCGRLAHVRLGVSLNPYMLDGPEVPAGVRLFPLRADPSCSPCHCSHLAFSFDAAGCTDVLLLQGDSFTQTSLPGLDSGQPSLLLASMPGGHVLQVTASTVRTLPLAGSGGAAAPAQWQPPRVGQQAQAPLTLAAAKGSSVAVLAGTALHILRVDPPTGALQLQATQQLGDAAQVSSLSLLRLPSLPASSCSQQQQPGGEEKGLRELYAAVGDWAGCSLQLLCLSDLQAGGVGTPPALELHLPGETPRSAAVLVAPAPPAPAGSSSGGGASAVLLMVGTNGGTVYLWQLSKGTSPAADGAWRAEAARQVRISNVAVELSEVLADGPDGWTTVEQNGKAPEVAASCSYVYAHSGCDAILRLRGASDAMSSSGSGATATADGAFGASVVERVEVCRVHGSGGLRAVCHLSTANMPNSMAWVNRDGRLLFGELQPEQRLRWATAHVGDTPHAAAYHAASHCVVVLTSDTAGGQWLRLVHADTLRQVLAFRLADGHHYTSLAVEQLPCSSQGSVRSPAAAPQRGGSAEAGTAVDVMSRSEAAVAGKQFVVLGSYLLFDNELDPSLAAGLHRTQGLLSFFEVTLELLAAEANGGGSAVAGASNGKPAATPPAEAAGSAHSRVRYGLVLHGTCPVPTVCMSLCSTLPQWVPSSASAAKPRGARPSSAVTAPGTGPHHTSSSPQALQPVVVAGGHDGVYAFRVHVDDCNTEGARLTARAAKALKAVEPLPFVVPPTAPAEPGQDKQQQQQQQQQEQQGKGGQVRGATSSGDAGSDDEELGLSAYVSARQQAAEASDEEDDSDWADEGEGDGNGFEGMPIGDGDGAAGAPSAADGSAPPQAAPGPRSKKLRRAQAAVRRGLARDWNQHVTLSLAGRAEAFAGAAVTAVHAAGGGIVYAAEFLGSVTALRLVCSELGVGLVPAAADRHAVFAQACVPLSATELLAAAHPSGLLLLQRSVDNEAAFVAQRQRQAMEEHERGVRQAAAQATTQPQQRQRGGAALAGEGAGRAAPGSSHSEALQQLGITAEECPGMHAMASARLCHSIYKMVHGRMGLAMAPPRASSSNGKLQATAVASDSATGTGERLTTHVLCFASDGAVLAVASVPRSNPAAVALADLQARLQQLPSPELALLTGVQDGSARRVRGWQLVLGSSREVLGDAEEATPLPGTATGAEDAEALPGFSVDGALLRALAALPQDVLIRLAKCMGMTVASLRQTLGSFESLLLCS